MLGLLEAVPKLVKWAWNKYKKPSEASATAHSDTIPQLRAPLLPAESIAITDTAQGHTSTEQAAGKTTRSCASTVATSAARVAFNFSAAVDVFVVLNGVARPCIAILSPEAVFGWTIAFAAFAASEFIVRSAVDVTTASEDTPVWKHANNPSLTASKSMVAMTQIAAAINPQSLSGLIVSTGLGFLILSVRQLKHGVDSSQIQFKVAVVPEDERIRACTPSKVGNSIDRGIEITTAGITLSYAGAGIIRFCNEAFNINPLAVTVATAVTLPSALILGTISAILIYAGSRSKPDSLQAKLGKYLAAVDSVVHNVPVQVLLTMIAQFDIYVLSQTRAGVGEINIPNWFLGLAATIALGRGFLVSLPVAALQGLENYARAFESNRLQQRMDIGLFQAPLLEENDSPSASCQKSCMSFWQGAPRLVNAHELRQLPTYAPPIGEHKVALVELSDDLVDKRDDLQLADSGMALDL